MEDHNEALQADAHFVISVFGDNGVGKSTFLQHLYFQKFIVCDPYASGEYYIKFTPEGLDSEPAYLRFYEFTHVESSSAMRELLIRNSQACILMCSISNHSLWQVLDQFALIERIKKKEQFPVLLVGNKCDTEEARVTTTKQLEDLAHLNKNVIFLETAAKYGINVNFATELLIRKLREFGVSPRPNLSKNPPKFKQTKKCVTC